MEFNYLTIGIKDKGMAQVKNTLSSLNIYNDANKSDCCLGAIVTINDLREDFLKMTEFLNDNNLDDDNPFFNDFDINPFGLLIEFNAVNNFDRLDILEPMVFILAQKLSSALSTDCIVMFNNMTLPVGLFSNGRLIDNFENYNEKFFRTRFWRTFRPIT